tara:strand:+ start:86 stop:331 length:246 start_codon:yes stop_codon:yes gene_type:complete
VFSSKLKITVLEFNFYTYYFNEAPLPVGVCLPQIIKKCGLVLFNPIGCFLFQSLTQGVHCGLVPLSLMGVGHCDRVLPQVL